MLKHVAIMFKIWKICHVLSAKFLSDLECPVCIEYVVTPIKLCTNGHNICSKCRGTFQYCPTCRAKFSEIRNVVLENIVRSQKYPCFNQQRGCLELFSIEHIAEHQAACLNGKIKCPFNLNSSCYCKYFKSDLKEHAKAVY